MIFPNQYRSESCEILLTIVKKPYRKHEPNRQVKRAPLLEEAVNQHE